MRAALAALGVLVICGGGPLLGAMVGAVVWRRATPGRPKFVLRSVPGAAVALGLITEVGVLVTLLAGAVGTPLASSPWRHHWTLGLCALAGIVASCWFAREPRS